MDDTQSPSVPAFTLSDQVAEELRALLARRRMSGRDLAKRLGVSPSWVSYRLTSTTEIGLNDLERIAAALDVRVADLLPAPATIDGSQNRVNLRYLPATARPRSFHLMHQGVAEGAPAHGPAADVLHRSGDPVKDRGSPSSDDHDRHTGRQTRPAWMCSGATP